MPTRSIFGLKEYAFSCVAALLLATLLLGACRQVSVGARPTLDVASPTLTPTPVRMLKPTQTPTETSLSTKTPTSTIARVPTQTSTPTGTPTSTAMWTPTGTSNSTTTPTSTSTATLTATPTPTGTVGIYALQPPDPESIAWKVYRNEKYGFEFEYPAIYDEYELEGRKPCELLETIDIPNFPANEVSVGSRTFLSFSSEEEDLETYVKQLIKKNTDSGGWYLASKQTHTVDGAEAISIEFEFGGMRRRGWATFFKQGDTLFTIDFSLWGGNTCELGVAGVFELQAYAHMVTSFRFLP